ncbi:hypothetical protein EUBDOL_01876 [Amedibacillus dolichus DSM 3991]|uniref:Uncharacterized protein n=1 Tax=Amedibacillus dolichus DSM 3991 TaxID=428127 RepID=A8RDA6_9FIRM|nr:hypothetical protein EUBDOL_01876 [Amedibacillus dolichus DSM 3991]
MLYEKDKIMDLSYRYSIGCERFGNLKCIKYVDSFI